jgi:hypothetical protein
MFKLTTGAIKIKDDSPVAADHPHADFRQVFSHGEDNLPLVSDDDRIPGNFVVVDRCEDLEANQPSS